MTAETKGIVCAQGQWTALATGKTKVLAMLRTIGLARIVTAAAAPNGEPASDYVSLTTRQPLTFVFDDTTTNVYCWPVGGSVTVEVVRE